MSNHMFDAIRNAAGTREALFIETLDHRLWTYGDMLDLSARFAGTLRVMDVQPGDRLAVQVEKSPEALILYLACLRAGVVYLLLNPAYTPAELDYFVADSKPRLIIAAPNSAASAAVIAAKHGAQVETLDDTGGGSLMERAERPPTDFADVPRAEDDLAAILYTSIRPGRQGGPKARCSLMAICYPTRSRFATRGILQPRTS
jgi:malonyl-CoA/methylmalonyl-CoA synthetase